MYILLCVQALNPKKNPTEGEETAEKEIETVKPHTEDDDDDDPESLLSKDAWLIM